MIALKIEAPLIRNRPKFSRTSKTRDPCSIYNFMFIEFMSFLFALNVERMVVQRKQRKHFCCFSILTRNLSHLKTSVQITQTHHYRFDCMSFSYLIGNFILIFIILQLIKKKKSFVKSLIDFSPSNLSNLFLLSLA